MTESRGLPPLNWLRSFEAAARHMSFTHAAEELGITQSAVSQQIKLLESFLRCALFLRRPRSLQLTDAGRDYLPFVTGAFHTLQEGTRPYLSEHGSSGLTIYINSAFSVFWLMPRLRSFTDAHPDISLNIQSSLWSADFAGDEPDIEIRYGRGEWTDRAVEMLSHDTFYPVCAPELAERLKKPADLRDVTLISARRVSDSWDHWAKAAGVKGVTEPGHHQFNTYVLAFEMARQGGGVALGHDTLCTGMIERGDLVRPFAESAIAQDNYYLLMPETGRWTAESTAFRTWLMTAFGKTPA